MFPQARIWQLTSDDCHGCLLAVNAEFALTGLGNIDGNSRNHELGVCLPHFQVQLDTACNLRLRPMYMQGASVSLLSVGAPGGRPNIPRATDSPSAIRTAVETSMGYYYLNPTTCPASYTSKVAGARLLASGGAQDTTAAAAAPEAAGFAWMCNSVQHVVRMPSGGGGGCGGR